MPRRTLLAGALALSLAIPGLALGHSERPTPSPAREGSVPDPNRTPTKTLDVCKTGECDYEHIQAAVLAAPDGALIRIWPGLYKEEPSRGVEELPADNSDGRTWSYEFQVTNPNAQNLIAIVGKKNITLRGMGAKPRDVVIDVEFKKHVGIRMDRADGAIVQNLSVFHAFDHGIYVLDQSGYLFDNVVSGYSREYGFLMFATDHGLTQNCEAFGAGDAGIYPGGAANTPGRFSNEVAFCKSYHNALGYSGTQGNYVYVHDNEFFDNGIGLTSDSETDHPNYPQEGLRMERNRFYNNNFNGYSENSDIEFVVFEGFAAVPIGVGAFILSGNNNVIQNNHFWGHDRYGMWLSSQAGVILGPISEPPALPFLSENNEFIANKMYNPSAPQGSENGVDFGWDGYGLSNCWQSNVRSPDGEPATSNVLFLPPCSNPVDNSRLPVTPGVPDIANVIEQGQLLTVEDTDGDGDMDRPSCDITGTCGYDWGQGPAPQNARNLPEGYQPPPTPPTCGPSTCPTSSTSVKGTKVFVVRGKAIALPATGVPAATGAALALLGSAVLIGARIRRRT